MSVTSAGQLLKVWSLRIRMQRLSRSGEVLAETLVKKLNDIDSNESIKIESQTGRSPLARFIRVSTGEILAETDEESDPARGSAPQFIAQITLYATEAGGRKGPISGKYYGCPCKFDPKDHSAWDCRILLDGETLAPGEMKQFGVAFLTPEAGVLFSTLNRFYLWEGRIIGEATAKF